ncbi:lachesin-like [Schistocerca cancellata]|uniref:lachesin-like n=1 Tax=Schistocerca cancellata TaxID=274614 RepID=UPI0021187271|nr:lachesin-like [Schistocerca cancellata]
MERQTRCVLSPCLGSRTMSAPLQLLLLGAACLAVAAAAIVASPDYSDGPKFAEAITNATVPVGREGIMACVVQDLGAYKVAWLRVDTQTILTIAAHVITKNHRIGVTHSDRRTWFLHIRDVRESDRGWYMCQINTDPMKSQLGYMQVVVPPDILDQPTSSDLVAREGDNVTLRCAASGVPAPTITWRREGGQPIPMPGGRDAPSVEGAVFRIARVSRLHMGPYLCIASNGVPPSVSKRISLVVHFPPMVWTKNQLVGAYEGRQVTIDCYSEAFPKSINYWTRDQGEILAHGSKYEPMLEEDAYRVHMRLTIRVMSMADFGHYKCVSKNSLGDAEGTVRIYRQEPPPDSEGAGNGRRAGEQRAAERRDSSNDGAAPAVSLLPGHAVLLLLLLVSC